MKAFTCHLWHQYSFASLWEIAEDGRGCALIHYYASLLVALYNVVDDPYFEAGCPSDVSSIHSRRVRLDDGGTFTFTRHNTNTIESKQIGAILSRSKLREEYNKTGEILKHPQFQCQK